MASESSHVSDSSNLSSSHSNDGSNNIHAAHQLPGGIGPHVMATGVAGSHARPNSTEVYGFVLWISTFVAFGGFLLWAYMPESWLIDLGVTYYPSKYWALAFPSYVVVLLCSIIVLYGAYNLANTNKLSDMHTITGMIFAARAAPLLCMLHIMRIITLIHI